MLDSELGIVIKDIYGIITVLSESLSLQVSITSSESILNKNDGSLLVSSYCKSKGILIIDTTIGKDDLTFNAPSLQHHFPYFHR